MRVREIIVLISARSCVPSDSAVIVCFLLESGDSSTREHKSLIAGIRISRNSSRGSGVVETAGKVGFLRCTHAGIEKGVFAKLDRRREG